MKHNYSIILLSIFLLTSKLNGQSLSLDQLKTLAKGTLDEFTYTALRNNFSYKDSDVNRITYRSLLSENWVSRTRASIDGIDTYVIQYIVENKEEYLKCLDQILKDGSKLLSSETNEVFTFSKYQKERFTISISSSKYVYSILVHYR